MECKSFVCGNGSVYTTGDDVYCGETEYGDAIVRTLHELGFPWDGEVIRGRARAAYKKATGYEPQRVELEYRRHYYPCRKTVPDTFPPRCNAKISAYTYRLMVTASEANNNEYDSPIQCYRVAQNGSGGFRLRLLWKAMGGR